MEDNTLDLKQARSELEWEAAIRRRLKQPESRPLEAARAALEQYPRDGTLLYLGAWASVVEERPEFCLRLLKRLHRFYVPSRGSQVCRAVALAQESRWSVAQSVLADSAGPELMWTARPPGDLDGRWLSGWLTRIRCWSPAAQASAGRRPSAATQRPTPGRAAAAVSKTAAMTAVEAPWPEGISRLKRIGLSIPVEVTLPSTDVFVLPDNSQSSREEFDLRHDLARLSLLKGFDTLLCLERLKGVEHFWYQTETVRKVLKQFRGRVLLGDEVGLGKTIEAGMILKEYLLRGMIHRVLILTPASLVGQWKEEMLSKFEVEFSTTQDVLLQRDPAAFWAQPRIIASIATARLEPHFSRIAEQSIDLVVVDEAHHLRNRTSRNWKLVDVLRKRFLLLLSATPVQNNLVELYNLLTLLKPGIFKTEKEFRARYMTPGNPRAPVNRGALQDLMRDVMIRNTRTLVDVRLPARHALTTRVAPTEEEAGCYQELSRLIRLVPRPDLERHRLALHHVLAAAGSSPAAAAAALRRFVAHVSERPWTELATRYTNIFEAGKARALLELLKRNPGEKKLVFSRLHETLNSLERALTCAGFSYARFDGTMTGPEKDEAVRLFRTDAEILLCSEAGGEGRNLQFCNTLINFDLPWNPQLIEQRIGRIHRIGQTREVFVFNLTAGGTLEDRILSILDEKLNMFELVVGEMQSILGHFNHERDFAEVVFAAWVEEAETTRESAFQKLALDLTRARRDYDAAKALDQDLFGEELEAV